MFHKHSSYLFVMWFSIPFTILQSESALSLWVILRILFIVSRDMGIPSFLIFGDICLTFLKDMGYF